MLTIYSGVIAISSWMFKWLYKHQLNIKSNSKDLFKNKQRKTGKYKKFQKFWYKPEKYQKIL